MAPSISTGLVGLNFGRSSLSKISILVDGMQLVEKRGTGIASYTRTLARGLNSLGARVSLLFGTTSRPRRGDPSYALATQIFCHRPPSNHLVQLASLAVRTRFGLKRTINADEVNLDAVDLTSLEPPLPTFERIFNLDDPLGRARAASAWGSPLATVVLPDEFAATHWTRPTPLKSSTGPNLYTIHDLVPIRYPYFVIDRPGHSARLHAAIAHAADSIITVSEASKANIVDVLKVAPERVTVTYQPAPTPSPLPQEDAEWIVTSIYAATPKAYALYLGAIEPKKNVRRLIEAFLLSRLKIPLLLVGPKGWLYDEEEELLAIITGKFGVEFTKMIETELDLLKTEGASGSNARASLSSNLPVRHLGYLPRRHVTALLQCAKFLIFPSLSEGFGLPALEAMQHSVPVLTSRIPPLCEVVGDAALLCDPLDIDDIARRIRELDADGDLRAELAIKGPVQAAQFSEEAYAGRLAEAYAKVGVVFEKATNSKRESAAAGR
jgi:glycosyltransferase involved in cell wall biosynthesis